MTNHDNILYSTLAGQQGQIGLITLNRPQALNALNHDMIQSLYQQLTLWAKDDTINAVVVKAQGQRAFCAGGDIRHIHDAGKQGDKTITRFFYDEYRLNHLIHHYPKPYIPLLHGITMGGGVGISIHGSHRVADHSLVFAMPETGIGFFPDVGGSYFLPRCPGQSGIYLGLSGARIDCHDACHTQLIDYIVDAKQFQALIDTLCDTDMRLNADAAVNEVLASFSTTPQDSTLAQHQALIDTCFTVNDIETIIDNLDNYPDEFAQTTCQTLRKKSPTSLKVTLAQLHRGGELDFDDCMRMEYRLVQHFLQSHDFYEGVRAAIIDKDNQPHWQPETLATLSSQAVDTFFSPLGSDLEFQHDI